MRILRSKFLLSFFATLIVTMNVHHQSSTSVAFVSAAQSDKSTTKDGVDDAPITIFRHKRGLLGNAVNWGLANIENVFDTVVVSELISAFISKCESMFQIMIHSFVELTSSYSTLHVNEVDRLEQFDKEFGELVKLRNKIERKCLYTSSEEDRSLCIDKEIEIHDKIRALRNQRSKSAASVERYTEMIHWCASYNNWFC